MFKEKAMQPLLHIKETTIIATVITLILVCYQLIMKLKYNPIKRVSNFIIKIGVQLGIKQIIDWYSSF